MPAEEQRSDGYALWCARRPDVPPLKRGLGGLRQAGPGICDSKYVEDEKAARSVRVWDRVPMKNKDDGLVSSWCLAIRRGHAAIWRARRRVSK